ncbi:asparagine synthase (glutamine-hydrolyzing) [Paraperlucidibaca wandonensis]|uniref:asparagine synthase (glutamine-hydrolyzing) n=1 Tax=Paraperlucidibaca wandonensis TaxID=1268273 RepID=A0ABW3HGL6_9GAMM
MNVEVNYMCGLSFFYSKSKSFSKEIQESLELTIHRGPDSTGVYETEYCDSFIGLGHNRLSIIELSDAGSQPMHNDNGYSIIFNGEIYNHNELRSKLKANNISFRGGSDTEVALQLYIEYGLESFSMLEGMFCIIILDKVNNKIHLARDAIGIKPVYISSNDFGIFASSEIKGLKPYLNNELSFDKNDIYEFFNTGFLYEPATGYKNIKKLMPGHVLTIDIASGNKVTKLYKKLSAYNNSNSFANKLNHSISNQLMADVPLGVFFSGGADSSILASMSNDADLFFAEYSADSSADIDKKYSKLIAEYLNKKLISYKFSDDDTGVDDLIRQVKFVAENTEELISDYTFWATYQLSMAAKESGYKVMLSGMGGDEAFAGYPRYHILNKHSFFKLLNPLLKFFLKFNVFPKKLDKKFERLVSYTDEDNWGVAYSRLLGYFSRTELKSLFKEKEGFLFANYSAKLVQIIKQFEGDFNDKVKLGQHMDRSGFLAHNLMVSDKASMLASIELRVPLLDEALVAHGYASNSANLIDLKATKKPLKNFLKSILPKSLIERSKTGFNPPIDTLIDKIGQNRLKQEVLGVERFIDEKFVLKLIDEHFSQKSNNAYKIWQILYFKYWVSSL